MKVKVQEEVCHCKKGGEKGGEEEWMGSATGRAKGDQGDMFETKSKKILMMEEKSELYVYMYIHICVYTHIYIYI